MSPPRHPEQLGPGDWVGPYRIVERLELGAFGFAFLVERDGRQFALKMAARPLAPEDVDRVEARLRRDLATFERLDHPAFPRVLEWGRWPDARTGHTYFVTSHTRGHTFHEWRWRYRVSLHRAVGSLALLARSLELLHARGLCHRDLRADNVLVEEPSGVPFLTGFMESHVSGDWGPMEGVFPESLYRQPPELVAFLFSEPLESGTRRPPHPSEDLYAFGVLLYETLTHCRPFDNRLSLERLRDQVLRTPPVDPRRLEPFVPEALAGLCLRLLDKSPFARPAHAGVVREALERWLAEAPEVGPWREPGPRPSERDRMALLPEGVEPLEVPDWAAAPPVSATPREDVGEGRWFGLVGWGVGGLAATWLVARMLCEAPVTG
ncbi:serine/threonine protein kinase [Archangium primigenium]|uniref:serine/threonine protein kinase n=1 Tax=[Archangium] primigenium TaxID=2792470 RepID=UPI001958AED7|nr:protein kinase [Archangium primigenium]MBM7112922.1 protein kinase [Archangium primigenium]